METSQKKLSTINPTIKRKWVDALRSRRYKQGEGQLRDGNQFCCLGVLATLVDPECSTWYEDNGTFGSKNDIEQELLGGYIQDKALDHLVCLNDGGIWII